MDTHALFRLNLCCYEGVSTWSINDSVVTLLHRWPRLIHGTSMHVHLQLCVRGSRRVILEHIQTGMSKLLCSCLLIAFMSCRRGLYLLFGEFTAVTPMLWKIWDGLPLSFCLLQYLTHPIYYLSEDKAWSEENRANKERIKYSTNLICQRGADKITQCERHVVQGQHSDVSLWRQTMLPFISGGSSALHSHVHVLARLRMPTNNLRSVRF